MVLLNTEVKRLALAVMALLCGVTSAQPPAIISLSPSDETLRPLYGSGMTLTASASGAEPLKYEWFRHQYLKGLFATGPTLELDSIGIAETITLRVSNHLGSIESDPIIVRPFQRYSPEIITPTRDLELTPGSPLEMSIRWSGSLPVVIEWIKDGRVIQSGQSSSLKIAEASESDGGIYTVRITNPLGSRESQIIVSPIPMPEQSPPLIISQPEDMILEVDKLYYDFVGRAAIDAASITTVVVEPVPDLINYVVVKAQGSVPMNFELYKGDTLIAQRTVTYESNGVATGHITLPTVTPESFGEYVVRVVNDQGSIDSNPFNISRHELSPPRFVSTIFPVDTTIRPGNNLNWPTYVAGTPPLHFQWFKDGEALPGKTTRGFYLHGAQEEDAGWYHLEVQGAGGKLTTKPVKLTVEEPTIPTPTVPSISVREPWIVEMTDGDTEVLRFDGTVTGAEPMTFTWHRNGTLLPNETDLTLNLSGAASDHVGEYHLTASNTFGESTRLAAIVYEIPGVAPIISHQSDSETSLELGETLVLEGMVDGHPMPDFRWFKDGQIIANQNYASFRINQVVGEDSGTYHFEASNRFGTIVSEDFTVTVDSNVGPRIMKHPDSFHIPPNSFSRSISVHVQNPVGATFQWFRDNQPVERQTQSYYFTSISPLLPGTYFVEVTQNETTVASAPAVMTEGEIPSPILRSSGGILAKEDTHIHSFTGGTRRSVPLLSIRTADVPDHVVWLRDGIEVTDQTDMSFWSDRWDGQAGSYQAKVTTEHGTFLSQPARIDHFDQVSTVIRKQPKSGSFGLGWYPGQGPKLEVEAESSAPMEFQWFQDGQPKLGALDSALSFKTFRESDIGRYFVRITTPSESIDSDEVMVDALPLELPVITRQPRDLTVTNPSKYPVSLSVRASSAHPITYEWFNNGESLGETTSDTLQLSPSKPLVPGTLQVTVSNAAGSVRSEAAEISLDPTPVGPDRIIGPADLEVSAGTNPKLTVSVGNAPGPVTTQWLRNGKVIPGATNFTLDLEDVSPEDAGEYVVVLSSGNFSYTSAPAKVTVSNHFSPIRGRHRIVGGGITLGEPVEIKTVLKPTRSLKSATYALLLPPGWSLLDHNAPAATLSPAEGQTDLLEWSWQDVSAELIEFGFRLSPPSNPTDSPEFAALLESDWESLSFKALVRPDPLRLRIKAAKHTADINRDGRISLSELLRVIELYNTRFESSRTGRYRPKDNSIDGFEVDSTNSGERESLITTFHHADTDWDGHLSLSELLRIIELYNTRTGTTRTGAYRRATDTVDGFAPGTGDE